MHKIEKIVYKCEYCGYEDEREDFMQIHEECCALNPKNQPCSTCTNMILGIGCSKKVDMEKVGGNVMCFFYKEGLPQTLFSFDGNHPDFE